MACSITLLEDTKVEANQTNLNYMLKDQKDFYYGVNVVGEHLYCHLPFKALINQDKTHKAQKHLINSTFS